MLALVLLSPVLQAQRTLETEALVFRAPWQAQLWVLARVPVAALQFTPSPIRCQAQLALRITCWLADGSPVGTWLSPHTLQLEDVETLPQAQQYVVLSDWLPLPNGKYQLRIDVQEEGTAWAATDRLVVNHFVEQGHALTGSDLVLSANYTFDRARLRPVVSGTLPAKLPGMGWYAELYSPRAQPISLRTTLYQTPPLANSVQVVQQFVSVQQYAETVQLQAGRNVLADVLPTDRLPPGEYLLELYASLDGQVLWRQRKAFSLYWQGLDSLLANMTQATALAVPALGAVFAQSVQRAAQPGAALTAGWGRLAALWQQPVGIFMSAWYYRATQTVAQWARAGAPAWQTQLMWGVPTRRLPVPDANAEVWRYADYDLVLGVWPHRRINPFGAL